MNQLREKLKEKQIKVLFTDYYDTLIHRTVHPNQVIRIWSKFIINELGLNVSIDVVYFTFKESVRYLVDKLNTDRNELPYAVLRDEVYTRLNNDNIIADSQKEIFIDLFEKAQLRAEQSIQYLNPDTIKIIQDFKQAGGQVYLISDFYGPKSLFEELLNHHKIDHLFNGIYISSTSEKSKHKGTIYNEIISELSIDPTTALMMGDNPISDSKHAEAAGLHSYVLPHKKYLRKNKLNGIGSDAKQIKAVVSKTYQDCNKKNIVPYTEYAVFYHFFSERLYKYCKANGIESLFFLSREGLFLKRLFDSYLEFHQINTKNHIRTHYLRVSRQASLQISLKEIEVENFSYLRRRYKSMSISEFLKFLNFEKRDKDLIYETSKLDCEELVQDFFDSESFFELKKNKHFLSCYEAHRITNKEVFTEYINSFGENIETDGVNVVDIGWGGTMQEAMYKFFNKKIKITGFYVGVNAIYNPNSDTKRHGLNFSVLPFEDYNSNILRANAQLYEQFASASHGSCIEYSKVSGGYAVEFHDENEKWLYDNHIKNHQDKMFEVHQTLMKNLESVCYDQDMVSNELISVALKSGISQSRRKIKFLETLNSGYYQNLNNKKRGIDYEIPKSLLSFNTFIKFFLKPEEYFRYVVKLKLKLYSSNKVLYFLFPGFLVLGYYKLNRFLRFKTFKNVSLLKFNYFK